MEPYSRSLIDSFKEPFNGNPIYYIMANRHKQRVEDWEVAFAAVRPYTLNPKPSPNLAPKP